MNDNNWNSASRVALLLERLGRLARGLQHKDGTRPVQWEALRYLARSNKLSRNPGALADFLGSTRGTVSQTLITLEKKGLLVRRPSSFDGRGMELELTDAGCELINQNPLKDLEDAAETLKDCNDLAKGLSGLLGELQKRKGYRAFGECRTCADFEADGKAGGVFRCRATGCCLSKDEADKICFKHRLSSRSGRKTVSMVAAE